MRQIGAGRPPLHRFRIGLEFAFAGRREVEDMVAQHARIARSLGEQLGLSDDIEAALLPIASFIDLKSPYTLGHSRAVGELAAEAASQLEAAEVVHEAARRTVRISPSLSPRLGKSNAIWDKPARSAPAGGSARAWVGDHPVRMIPERPGVSTIWSQGPPACSSRGVSVP